jgi:DnaJ-class molecular chaperone
MPLDYYAILGVRRDATVEEIREAYQEKARHCLVDRDRDAEESEAWLQSLRAAWETLSDSSRRAVYDAASQAGPENGQVAEPSDSPERLKRRITELEAELASIKRQRDKYYRWAYQLAQSPLSTESAEELIAQPEGTPIVDLLAEAEVSLKE